MPGRRMEKADINLQAPLFKTIIAGYWPTGPFFQYFIFFQRVSDREPLMLYTPHLK